MKKPEFLFCWNFQADKGGWESGWGGYARQKNLYPLDEKERLTGATYIRSDLIPVEVLESLRSEYGKT